jgi:hypothetical protein
MRLCFARFASMIGHPELPWDPPFNSDEARTAHEPELKAIIENRTRSKSVEEIAHLGVDAGIPAAPIQRCEISSSCLGEPTDEVFGRVLGLDAKEVEPLKQSGVVS